MQFSDSNILPPTESHIRSAQSRLVRRSLALQRLHPPNGSVKERYDKSHFEYIRYLLFEHGQVLPELIGEFHPEADRAFHPYR